MTAAVFYAVVSGASLAAILAEIVYSRRRGKDWYRASDTLGNFNLAAGNVMLGALSAGLVIGGYQAFYALRVVTLEQVVSPTLVFVAAVVVCDFLSYGVHRLAHRWNVLWLGHITHHSSSEMNLSTGIRVSWLYRSYVWVLFTPMALLGFPLESYLFGQMVINVYNLFMHTRLNVPFGPLRWVLVTPRAHRLHHSAHPSYFGNYGAALIVWDRLFGTYRELEEDADRDLAFGIDRNVDTADPIWLNVHYIAQMWHLARAQGRSFLGLLMSTVPLPSRVTTIPRASAAIGPGWWWACAGVVALGLAINQGGSKLPLVAQIGAVLLGLALCVGFGRRVQRLSEK